MKAAESVERVTHRGKGGESHPPRKGWRESPTAERVERVAHRGKGGESRPPRKCKADGKECCKYRRLNHFAKCCVSKNVKTQKANLARRSKHEGKYSSDESTYIIRVWKRDREMITTVLVANGKVQRNHEFQLHTAATSNVLTRRDCAFMGKP